MIMLMLSLSNHPFGKDRHNALPISITIIPTKILSGLCLLFLYCIERLLDPRDNCLFHTWFILELGVHHYLILHWLPTKKFFCSKKSQKLNLMHMPQPGDLNFFKSILIIETMQLKSVTELKSRNIYICSGRCLTG
jgi:hypothetical protein